MPVKRYQDDLLLRLKDSDYAATYLKVALDEMLLDGETEAFLLALKNVVEARGKAKDVGITRQPLYRLLAGDGNPTLGTMVAVLKAVGFTMDFKPLDEE